MKIHEIHNIYGVYLCWKKKMGYILYSKHIHASHIWPSKRNQLFKQREWESRFSVKHGLWPVNYVSKPHVLWKPKMIPRSLRSFCPSRFAWKPPIEVQFLTKVLKSTFSTNHWIWKTWKMELATKSRPPDCVITSVSSCEYVCCHFQPIEPRNLNLNRWTEIAKTTQIRAAIKINSND